MNIPVLCVEATSWFGLSRPFSSSGPVYTKGLEENIPINPYGGWCTEGEGMDGVLPPPLSLLKEGNTPLSKGHYDKFLLSPPTWCLYIAQTYIQS